MQIVLSNNVTSLFYGIPLTALRHIGCHLFRGVSGNRYLSIGSNENIRCVTSTGNNTALGFGHDSLNSLKTGKVI